MDGLQEIARFTLREGRCGLCGSDALTRLVSGFQCQCGAISLDAKPRPTDPERAEDEAVMRDHAAAEGTGIDRSLGG